MTDNQTMSKPREVTIRRFKLLADSEQEMSVATKEDIDSIVSIFKKIPDSHVVLETIQPKNLYTGDRIREVV